MADWTGFAFPKPTPRVLVKKAKDAAKLSAEKVVKAQVRKRDPFCRVCLFRKSCEVHELKFRSRGGAVSLVNSIGVCAAANGGLCHQLLQTHSIEPCFAIPVKGAEGPMTFEMNASTAKAVFGRRIVARHIEVTE
jgi:hypothetical protein